jgi:hypothetical protein
MNNLALVLQRKNRLKEVEQLYRKVIKFQEANILPNNPAKEKL